MNYKAEWDAINHFETPVPDGIVTEVNALLFAPDPAPNEIADVSLCIILGSTNCAYRAERAADMFADTEAVCYVACGGNLSTEGRSEARLIADTLLKRGTPADHILLEEHSANTRENMLYVERLLHEYSDRTAHGRTAIVSAGFHRLRVFSALPASLSDAVYINAYGPNTRPDNWYLNQIGRKQISHELSVFFGKN
ncbi:MAG: YdcF family protein [Lachnospiraceae bacterium]